MDFKKNNILNNIFFFILYYHFKDPLQTWLLLLGTTYTEILEGPLEGSLKSSYKEQS